MMCVFKMVDSQNNMADKNYQWDNRMCMIDTGTHKALIIHEVVVQLDAVIPRRVRGTAVRGALGVRVVIELIMFSTHELHLIEDAIQVVMVAEQQVLEEQDLKTERQEEQ